MPDLNPTGVVAVSVLGIPSAEQLTKTDFEQLIYVDDLANTFFSAEEVSHTRVRYYFSALGKWKNYDLIWDDPHASVAVGENEFNTLRPQFQIPEYDLLHPIQKNDRCIVKGKEYRVDDYMSDGVGVTTVYLRLK
jgi:hypothetical protein